MICEGTECERCGYEMIAGEPYAYDDNGKIICGECVRNMIADWSDAELMEMLGYEVETVISEEEYRDELKAERIDRAYEDYKDREYERRHS